MNLGGNWRRMVGAMVLVLAVGWLVGRASCKNEAAEAVIRFQVGDAGPGMRSIRAELRRGDDPDVLAYWEKNFDERGSGPVVGPWSLRADAGAYRIEVVVRTDSASRRATRAVDLRDGASITVDVTDALPQATDPAAR